uniref:AEC family transporter n=1 Tax=Rhodosalinus sediminis TaxID=1940533 RepID=UPI002352CBD5
SLGEVLNWRLVGAYLCGTAAVYALAMLVAFLRGLDTPTAAVEAQCAAIGNTGFLGVPMLTLLLGAEAIGPVMMALAVDLIVFSSLIVILITGARDGRMSVRVLGTVGMGLLRNPMIVAISLGFAWSAVGHPLPEPADAFLALLGAAATPGALFAIGASLATKSAERVSVAAWLSVAKLVLHPAAVALAVFVVFPVEPYQAGVVTAAAALPVAGNVYMLAQHYGVAPQRVSAAILFSTAASILTVTFVIAQLPG